MHLLKHIYTSHPIEKSHAATVLPGQLSEGAQLSRTHRFYFSRQQLTGLYLRSCRILATQYLHSNGVDVAHEEGGALVAVPRVCIYLPPR